MDGDNGKVALDKELNQLKEELASLRVAQVTNGAPAKLNKIREVRKGIARVLTILNQSVRASVRAEFKGARKALIPKDMRFKKTRAIRRRLSFAETHVLSSAAPSASKSKKFVKRTTLRASKKASGLKTRPYTVLPEKA